MIRRITPILLLALSAGPAAADSKFYYGLSFHSAELETATGYNLETNGFGLKFGREFGKVFSLELQGGTSADDTENLLRDPEITFGGLFARLNLPFERVNLYMLAGATKFNTDIQGVDIPETDNSTEAAVGFGMDLFGSETTALTIEAITYTKDENLDDTVEVLNFGYTHRFEFPRFR